MKTDTKYNGWTNWETWSFNLHWDDAFSEDAQRAYDEAESDSTFTREENAAFLLADCIKEIAEETIDSAENKPSLWTQDIINGYMSEVNFHEIARHYIDEVEKEQAA